MAIGPWARRGTPLTTAVAAPSTHSGVRGRYVVVRPGGFLISEMPFSSEAASDRQRRGGARLIEVAHDGEWIVVRLEGEIDVVSAPAAQDRIAELHALGYRNIRIDLERVEFLDSQGINLLVGARKSALAAGGQMEIHKPPERVMELLRIMKLDDIFTIVSDGDRGQPASS
jgi:anti-sigma B factor antagonist